MGAVRIVKYCSIAISKLKRNLIFAPMKLGLTIPMIINFNLEWFPGSGSKIQEEGSLFPGWKQQGIHQKPQYWCQINSH